VIVRDASDEDVLHICRNLRPEDRLEQFAARFDDDPDALAADLIRWRQVAIKQLALCTEAGEPAILVGAYLETPTVARFHMASTPALVAIGREGHRFGKRRFIPAVLAPNVAMAEARIMATHFYARRWVATCGFIELAGPHPYGKHGEAFVLVAWLNPTPPPLQQGVT
jgi:hypothetical protein